MLKEQIYKGIDSGIVKITLSPNDGCIACEIGEHWFYFIGREYENMTPNEVLDSFTQEELTEMIYSAVMGLEQNEIDYYTSILGEIVETGTITEKYAAAGVRICPGSRVTIQQMLKLLSLVAGDEYEPVTFETDKAICHFVFSLPFYEANINGESLEQFKGMFAGIADDVKHENPNCEYRFNNHMVYFG